MTKYQVFISSTFHDLKEERQAAVEAILKRHHIPAGMELFSAGNDSQLQVVKDWIQDSDIYMLILGGRYGSIEPKSGLSYTEIEYNYALKLKKPLFALIINDEFLEEKAKSKSTKEVFEMENRDKYSKFKKVVESRVCKWVRNLTEIKLETTDALNDILDNRRYNLQGWIRKEAKLNQPVRPIKPHSYGITIFSPTNGQTLSNPVKIAGTFKKMPPMRMFFCIELNPNLGSYWPKNEIDFDKDTLTWGSVMGMGQGDDKDRNMLVVAVGQEGFKVINEFYKSSLNKGLDKLTDDMVVVDEVTIKLKKEN